MQRDTLSVIEFTSTTDARDCAQGYPAGISAARREFGEATMKGQKRNEEKSVAYRIGYDTGYNDKLDKMEQKKIAAPGARERKTRHPVHPTTAVNVRDCALGYSSGTTRANRGLAATATKTREEQSPSYNAGYNTGYTDTHAKKIRIAILGPTAGQKRMRPEEIEQGGEEEIVIAEGTVERIEPAAKKPRLDVSAAPARFFQSADPLEPSQQQALSALPELNPSPTKH